MSDTHLHVISCVLAQANTQVFAHINSCAPNDAVVDILAKDKAVDIYISSEQVGQTISKLEPVCAENSVDMCTQLRANRRKRLLMCDMDSTLIGQECIDELADYVNMKTQVSAITEAAMQGELDFESALRERVALLKGLELSTLQACFEERIHLNPGARTLCQTMRAFGAKTVIVSGGFTFFTSRIRDLCGFDHHHANVLEDDGHALSGKVSPPILGRDAKRSWLEYYASDLGGLSNAVAIGDGANDLAMIQAASLGIAYYAKPAVSAAAHCAIKFTDLTSALYFQGYKHSEFVGL